MLDGNRFIDDPTSAYLAVISEVPPLTASEEIRRIELLRAGGKEEMKSAETRLVEANLHLVVAIAGQPQHNDLHFLDRIQAGNEGLLKAVQTLRENNNPENFSVYATPFIEDAIERSLASPDRNPLVPAHLRQT